MIQPGLFDFENRMYKIDKLEIEFIERECFS